MHLELDFNDPPIDQWMKCQASWRKIWGVFTAKLVLAKNPCNKAWALKQSAGQAVKPSWQCCVWVGALSSNSNSNSRLPNSDLIWISSPDIKTKLKFKLRDQKSSSNSNLSSRPGTSSNSNLSSKFEFSAKHMGSSLQHERHMDGNFPLPLGPLEVRLLLNIIQRQKSVCISGSSNHEGQSGDSSLCICDCNSQLQQTTGKNFQVSTCSQIWNLESKDRLHQAFAWTRVLSVH